ncbi:MFS transporter [Nocardioides sp. HDW12B]|uniref:MFS transporter n=1 Tax=Nocardioides sp. HDW12B TaxID=2714939 RepID=UPI00197DEEB5|nr:MFS transporter [Nocardioides sp. HDW12B]
MTTPTGERAPEQDDQEPDPRRWRVLAVTLLVGFMALLDVTIVNIALPSIRTGLGTSAGTVQWVVSGYALAFGLVLVTGGRLGDAWGRRRLMLLGLSGFILSSAAAGLAPSIEVLIAARLLQGFSAGLLTPQSSGLIQTLFRGPERGVAFGLFGLTVSVSSAIGPVLGGVIIAAVGGEDAWRWIFLVNLPIGLVGLVAIALMVPAARPDRADPRLDVVGALLLGGSVLCLLFPVISLESGARLPLLLLPVSVALVVGFLRWERRTVARGGAPLLDLALLREVPGYARGIVIGSLYFTGFTGVFLVLSVFLQDGLGLSPLDAGLLLTPFAVGSAVASPVAGRLVSRVRRPLTVVALLLMMSGLVVLAALVPRSEDGVSLWLVVALPLLLAGLGGGAVVSPNFTLTLADVPPRMGGAAGGAVQTGQRLGASLGAALLVTSYELSIDGTGSPVRALQVALALALLILAAALVVAVRGSRRPASSGAPTPGP